MKFYTRSVPWCTPLRTNTTGHRQDGFTVVVDPYHRPTQRYRTPTHRLFRREWRPHDKNSYRTKDNPNVYYSTNRIFYKNRSKPYNYGLHRQKLVYDYRKRVNKGFRLRYGVLLSDKSRQSKTQRTHSETTSLSRQGTHVTQAPDRQTKEVRD